MTRTFVVMAILLHRNAYLADIAEGAIGLLGNGSAAGLSSCDALNRCIAFIQRATDSSMYSVVKSDNLSKLCFLKCDLMWKSICQGDWCIR